MVFSDSVDGRTFFPLNVATTFAAPSSSRKIISAMTVGKLDTSLQLDISPPMLYITLSISAAVVPGAKFCAITTFVGAGTAAAPLMLKPEPRKAPDLVGDVGAVRLLRRLEAREVVIEEVRPGSREWGLVRCGQVSTARTPIASQHLPC